MARKRKGRRKRWSWGVAVLAVLVIFMGVYVGHHFYVRYQQAQIIKKEQNAKRLFIQAIAPEALDVLNDNMEMMTASRITCDETVAKVSIIGAGMVSNPGVAAKMFEALANGNVNIKMIATSEIRITVLIDENDANRAMRLVHDAFDLAE